VVEWEAVEWEAVEWVAANEAHVTRYGVSVAEIEQVLATGMTRSACVRQAALSSAGGRVVDVARVRRSVDEAERQLSAAREALG